jgi:hypothetical protein
MKLHKVLGTEASLNEFRFLDTKKEKNQVNRSKVTSLELLGAVKVCIEQRRVESKVIRK